MEKGISSLIESVKKDCKTDCECSKNFSECKKEYGFKLRWIFERAEHYAIVLHTTPEKILENWESKRTYWYMNYYQDSNQPVINEKVRVFDSIEDFRESVQKEKGFRCPKCGGVSTDPYECSLPECDWKAYGLFGTLGKGVDVIIKDSLEAGHIFMPIAWETK